jgi:hypothetical protein
MPVKARPVVNSTVGLRIGAANRKAITCGRGMPFSSRLRMIGTTPHSHTGTSGDSATAAGIPNQPRRRDNRGSRSSGTSSSIRPANSDPSTRYGRACRMMAWM